MAKTLASSNTIELLRFTFRHSASIGISVDQAVAFLWRHRVLVQRLEVLGECQEATIATLDALAKDLLGDEYIWPTTQFSPEQAASFYREFVQAARDSDYNLLIPFPDEA